MVRVSIGTGVALAIGCPTVVVDGDGSLLMNPAGLLTAGGFADLPLLHIVLADGCYASTGGQPVPAPRADFCALATASGYARVVASEELSGFSALVRAAVAECRSPTFILAVLNEPDAPVPARIDVDLGEHARRFQAIWQASGRRAGAKPPAPARTGGSGLAGLSDLHSPDVNGVGGGGCDAATPTVVSTGLLPSIEEGASFAPGET